MSESPPSERAPSEPPSEASGPSEPRPLQLSGRTSAIVLVLAILGGGGFFLAGRLSVAPEPEQKHLETRAPLPPLNSFPEVSFAQQGEDLIIKNIFAQIGIGDATYLDIGAHDPVRSSNTYLFYALGSKGVVVEPNPLYAGKLKATRTRDRVIDKGIGAGTAKTGKYYEYGGDGADNTFSEEQAKRLEAMGVKPLRVTEMPLVDINEVLAENFKASPPDLLSLDTEGTELAILQAIDFERFRPPVICVDTLAMDSGKPIAEIGTFLATKGYSPRGGTFVNTVFVSDAALARARGAGIRGSH